MWARDDAELFQSVWGAAAHAMLNPPSEHRGAIHVIATPGWVVVIPDFAAGLVRLDAGLIDAHSSRGLASAVGKLNALGTPFKFAIDGDARITVSSQVSARPFIPIHLGQVLLDLIEFTRSYWRSEIELDLDGTRVTDRVFSDGPGIPWCGTGTVEFESMYASTEAHPQRRWMEEDQDDEEWS